MRYVDDSNVGSGFPFALALCALFLQFERRWRLLRALFLVVVVVPLALATLAAPPHGVNARSWLIRAAALAPCHVSLEAITPLGTPQRTLGLLASCAWVGGTELTILVRLEIVAALLLLVALSLSLLLARR